MKKDDDYIDEFYIKRQSEIVFKDARAFKFKLPITLSIFAALIIPLWNNFLIWNYKEIKTLDIALITSLFIFISLIFMSIILINIEKFLMDNIFNKEYYKMKELAELLDQIYYEEVNTNKRTETSKIILIK